MNDAMRMRLRNGSWSTSSNLNLEREALPGSLAAYRIVPAKLGKNLGNYGAVCAALYESDERN